MSDPQAIRQTAKEELGEWLIKSFKEQIREMYLLLRESFSWLTAKDALDLAREFTQESLDDMIDANFYGRSPF